MSRGEVAVVIPVFGAHDHFVECMRSVLAHTPVEVPVLVMDDASPDSRSRRLLVELDEAGVLSHAVHYLRSGHNIGFVRTVNCAFRRCDPGDAIILNSDCIVTAGWFEAIRVAARDSLVATVSVFTNHGTILSLPFRNQPLASLPQTLDLDVAAIAVQSGSLRIRPRLPTAVGHCFLVKRAALDLVGDFDEAFSPGYGEEVDFSQRCLRRGLVHALADDAFVLHKGSASFDPRKSGNKVIHEHEEIIRVRYGYYDDWIQHFSNDFVSPFSRAIGAAQRSLKGLSVTIDARCLGPILTGTQLHTLELIAALSREGGVHLRAVVPTELGAYAREVLAAATNVEVRSGDAGIAGLGRTDVVHRPMQVSSPYDLELLGRLGERVVITHQDLIGYHNPGYHDSFADWSAYRHSILSALAYAERVLFFSHSAAREAIAEELLPPEAAEVVYIGTDHTLDAIPAQERPPRKVDMLPGRPFLLCLGTDFSHKNRLFALRVFESLKQRCGFDGGLILAGPHVPIGSSAADEAEFIAKHPELSVSIIDVASVDEGEKRWLLRNATLMLYPSVHEGFGLVPFEAAEAGLACAFAFNTALAELLPRALALIEQWDPDVTADRLAPYLGSPTLRAEHVAAVRAAGARFTWRSTARRLIEVYRQVASAPVSEARKLVEAFVDERRDRERAEDALRTLRDQYDVTAQGLVGPNGVIPSNLRRPLLAIGTRPALSRPAFGLLRAAYVGGYRVRHLGRAPQP